jgi:hypothetical protein
MANRIFNIEFDGPTLISPNGGEQFFGSTILITWEEPVNLDTTTDIVWYELFITELYSVDDIDNLIQIATLPSGSSSFTYNINKNLKGDKCRIGIRAVNHKGQRSSISFSADNFLISNRKLPRPAVFTPTRNSTYFSYIPVTLDSAGVIGRCSQRAFYQVYYKSESQGIDWVLVLQNITVGSKPINLDVSNFNTASDYSLKVELVDGDNISSPVFIDDITINNINYFTIDTVAPRGEIKIENSEEYTKENDLVLSLKSSDSASAVRDYRIRQISIDADGNLNEDTNINDPFFKIADLAIWDILFQDTIGDGEKIIQVEYRDYGNNVLTNSGDNKYFRTYKNVANMVVAGIVFDGVNIWIVYSDEDNPSLVSSRLYRNNNFISDLVGEPTALALFEDTIYIAIRDVENKGVLQRYTGSTVESVADNEEQYLDDNDSVINSLYSSDSVIVSMIEFDSKLFLGLENGELLSFNGVSVSSENNDFMNIKSIKKIDVEGTALYVFFENTTELMIMTKLVNGTYNFSIVDSEE